MDKEAEFRGFAPRDANAVRGKRTNAPAFVHLAPCRNLHGAIACRREGRVIALRLEFESRPRIVRNSIELGFAF